MHKRQGDIQQGGFYNELKESQRQARRKKRILSVLGSFFGLGLLVLLLMGAWTLVLSVLIGAGVGYIYEVAKQKLLSSTNKLITSKRLRKNKFKLMTSVMTAAVIVGLSVGVGFVLAPALGLFVMPSSTAIISVISSHLLSTTATALFAGVVSARVWVSNLFENYNKRSISSWTLVDEDVKRIRMMLSKNEKDEKKRYAQLQAIKGLIRYVNYEAKKLRFFGIIRKPGSYDKLNYYKRVIVAAKDCDISFLRGFIHYELKCNVDVKSSARTTLIRLEKQFSSAESLFSSFNHDSGFRSIPDLEQWKYKPVMWWNGSVMKTSVFTVSAIAAAAFLGLTFPVFALSALSAAVVYKSSQEWVRNMSNIAAGEGYKRKKSTVRFVAGLAFSLLAVGALIMNPLGTSFLAVMGSVALVTGSTYVGSQCAKQLHKYNPHQRRSRHSTPMSRPP